MRRVKEKKKKKERKKRKKKKAVARLLIGCLFFLLTPRSTSGPDRLGETSLAVTGPAT